MNQDAEAEHNEKPPVNDNSPRDEDGPVSWSDLSELMDELNRMAHGLLAGEDNAQSIQTTDLVDSALRRAGGGKATWKEMTWENRKHFCASMYSVMRHVLIDHARKRRRRIATVPLDESRFAELPRLVRQDPDLAVDVQLVIDELEKRQGDGPELAEFSRYWLYAGLNCTEIARFLGEPRTSVRRLQERAKLLFNEKLGRPPLARGA
ncbi:MAG: ECF-type sigma factor [Phycisphaerae bacterium]